MFYKLRRRLWRLCPKLNVEYVYSHNLEDIPERKCRIPVTIFKLSLEDVHRILEIRKMPLGKLRSRLKRGDLCYVTEYENKLIAYQWVQFSGEHFIQQAGKIICVKPGDFWIYHARVLEEFRSNGINTKIKSDLMIDAKNDGYRRALIYTNKQNIANQKGLQRLGFKWDSIVYSLKINQKYHRLFTKTVK